MKILNDFNTTVKKALEEIDPKYMDYKGLVICGTHSPHDVEEMIQLIQQARETKTPFLGICFGHQLAAIEYARNVLGIQNATSEEFGQGNFVVYKLPALRVGLQFSHTEHLDSGFDMQVFESFWNNYEVMPDILNIWKKEKNFITCQYHPEYQSRIDNPHPLLVKFIESCRLFGK
ncbi:MAG: hypothetical protein AABY22_33055 [Nanoarchaeota archaeon]